MLEKPIAEPRTLAEAWNLFQADRLASLSIVVRAHEEKLPGATFTLDSLTPGQMLGKTESVADHFERLFPEDMNEQSFRDEYSKVAVLLLGRD